MIGLAFLAIACARHQKTILISQDCNVAGYCTDLQLRADTVSTIDALESDWPNYGRTPYGDRRCMIEDAWGNTWQIATQRAS